MKQVLYQQCCHTYLFYNQLVHKQPVAKALICKLYLMHGSSNLNFTSILFLCKCFVNPLKYTIAVTFAWGLSFVTQTRSHCFNLLLFPRFVLFALMLSSPCLHLIFRHQKIERPMRHFQLSQINILKRFWCQVLKLVTYNKNTCTLMKVNISAHQRSGKVNDVSQFRKTSFTMEISSP